jgi:sigma-E factor negative regulatory protein RseA
MDNSVNDHDAPGAARRALSCLMDGDDGGGDATAATSVAFVAWSRDAEARSAWHAYHLIGDVLRSDDLAEVPARDAAFLTALRGRLAQEPVPLAPAPLPRIGSPARPPESVAAAAAMAATVGARSTRWWMAPAAVAAGFVAVAGLLVVTRVLAPDAADRPQLAQAQRAAPAAVAVAASGDVVRNAGLDRYLEAHRSLANGVVAAGGAEHRVQILFESK